MDFPVRPRAVETECENIGPYARWYRFSNYIQYQPMIGEDSAVSIAPQLSFPKLLAAIFQRIADGKADAFAADDVLLHGLIARHGAQRSFVVVGEFLSYDPYGIMFRKNDEQLAETVLQAFRRMAENGDLYEYYHRWFVRWSPTGERLDMPMTAQLMEIFRVLGAPD